MENKSLTLAFACLGERLPKLVEHLASLSVFPQVNFVILVQKPLTTSLQIKPLEQMKIVILENIGLSKSRNAAIDHANSDFIWFLDDDVCLSDNHISEVLSILAQGNADFYRVKIGCIEWPEKTFKQYKPVNKVSRLNLLQVSSIEIIANLQLIKQHQLSFNENIGLGTPYQSCEENNFLLDAWQHGAHFQYIDRVLVRHTCVFENRVLATNKIFEIRGATASRFGLLGPVLMARWITRYLLKEKKLSYVKSLLLGYFRGYDYYKKNLASK